MSTVKEQAEALRLGLLGGYVSSDEVTAWADQVIAAGDTPGPEIIEVSLGGSKPIHDIDAALAGIPGFAPRDAVAVLTLRQMAAAVRQNPSVGRAVAHSLFQMYLEGIVPSEQAKGQMGRLDDAFYLAESGIHGTTAEVQAELAEFLSTWDETT